MNGLILQTPYYSLRGSHNNRIAQGAHNLLQILNYFKVPTKLLNMDAKDAVYGTRQHILASTNSSVDLEFDSYDFTLLNSTITELNPDFMIVICGDIVVPTVDIGSPRHTAYVVKHIRSQGYTGRIIGYGPFLTEIEGIDTHIYGDCEHNILDIITDTTLKKVVTQVPEAELSTAIPDLTTDNLIIPINPIELDSISSSRGCIGVCQYCIAPGIYNRKIRYVDPWYFVNRIMNRVRNYGVRNFYFTDLLFTANRNHAMEICDYIIEAGINITWRCEARIDTLNEALLKRMKKAGCEYIKLGVESMNDCRLKWMDKRIKVKQIAPAIALLKKIGIKSVVYILLGGTEFTDKSYMKELQLFRSLDADKYTVSILNPMKGSKLYTKIPWVDEVTDNISHLDSTVIAKWGISQSVVDAFFELEVSHHREDDGVRNYE